MTPAASPKITDRLKPLARVLVNGLSLGYFEKLRATRQRNFALTKRYLDLLQSCLAGVIYEDLPLAALGQKDYNPQLREFGWDWPSKAHTMIGFRRLDNVRRLVETILKHNVPGDLIETGVWRGGACIMMRGVLEAYGIKNRRVWLADSFAGLPAPSPHMYPSDAGAKFHEYKDLAVPLDEVKNNFKKYGLLDEQLVFLPGWFKDSLPNAPITSIALLRLDGDLYESTITALEHLYDKVVARGYIIVDDYNVIASCKQAVHDFLDARKLKPSILEIDGVGVYWQKA